MAGERFDRYGSDFGTFVSPVGAPFEMRALPYGPLDKPYGVFEVVKPFEVRTGTIAPPFGRIGLGTQHGLPLRVDVLLRRRIIRRVSP
jgi:hypothetical protein